jgi:putative glycosyltransferase (TIGR04372 family)
MTFKKILITVFFFPLVLVIFLIKPIILIRFGVIDASRIGHFCNTVGYLVGSNELHKRKKYDVLCFSNDVCNHALKEKIGRYAKAVLAPSIIYKIILACKIITRGDEHEVKFPVKDLQLISPENAPLSFTIRDHERGNELLSKLGMKKNAKWICVHNRDSSYLKTAYPNIDWSYHNFRDFDVEDMTVAIEELVARGYFIVRMGVVTESKMNLNHPKVIDYANHEERSDFADIYLLGNCEFYFGSDSGIFAVSTIFNRPYSFINFPAIEPLYKFYYGNKSPFILRHLLLRDENRLLSLKEIYSLGLEDIGYSRIFESKGIEVINNTPEEIRDLAIEVDERNKGGWIDSEEDLELQSKFWEIIKQYSPNDMEEKFVARVGTLFLRNNQYLLNS